MSLFDSATPIQRRRRNQKKDESVIERLRSNSLQVVDEEVVYNCSDWSFNKARVIDGVPSSPPPESPLLSPATFHNRDSTMSMGHETNLFEREPAFLHDRISATPHEQTRYNLRHDARVEQRMQYTSDGAPSQGKKRSLNVFQDQHHRNNTKQKRMTKKSALKYEDDDDDYVEEPRRVRRRVVGNQRGGDLHKNHGQLSFGRSLGGRDLDDEELDDDDEGSGMTEPRKQSSGLPSDEEQMFRNSMMQDQDPFGLNHGPSTGYGFGHPSMFSGPRHRSNLSVNGFNNGGFSMTPSAPNGMAHNSFGFGQYPGSFNFGGFNMGMSNEYREPCLPVNMSHGNQMEFGFNPFGYGHGQDEAFQVGKHQYTTGAASRLPHPSSRHHAITLGSNHHGLLAGVNNLPASRPSSSHLQSRPSTASGLGAPTKPGRVNSQASAMADQNGKGYEDAHELLNFDFEAVIPDSENEKTVSGGTTPI
jgi:hypothetical protein